MCSVKALRYYIEYKRSVMIEAAKYFGMSDEVTLRLSQELDELLNEHRRIVMQSEEEQQLTAKLY